VNSYNIQADRKNFLFNLTHNFYKFFYVIYNKMNRIQVINSIIDKKKAQTYLEIGVQTGNCFNNIKCPKKIAVDPEILTEERNLENYYFEMTSNKFFRKKRKILKNDCLDVVFIDGLHNYRQSLKDVKNSLNYLNEGGVIVMHDCNPPSQITATPGKSINYVRKLNLPEFNDDWCGDVWKTIPHLRSMRNDLKILVFNYDVGIGIITKGEPSSMLNYTEEEIKMLTYDDLKKNPEYIVNLKPFSYFFEFIKAI